jgi:hypothetical protein
VALDGQTFSTERSVVGDLLFSQTTPNPHGNTTLPQVEGGMNNIGGAPMRTITPNESAALNRMSSPEGTT